VFIDETAVTTKMTRLYGRAPLGERLVAKVPYGHWKTLTLVAALRVDGVTAPYVIDGAILSADLILVKTHRFEIGHPYLLCS